MGWTMLAHKQRRCSPPPPAQRRPCFFLPTHCPLCQFATQARGQLSEADRKEMSLRLRATARARCV